MVFIQRRQSLVTALVNTEPLRARLLLSLQSLKKRATTFGTTLFTLVSSPSVYLGDVDFTGFPCFQAELGVSLVLMAMSATLDRRTWLLTTRL